MHMHMRAHTHTQRHIHMINQTHLHMLWMALSRRFSSVVSSLSLGFLARFDPCLSSSVTVMRMLVGLAEFVESEYLFSLLKIGDGVTRKSLKEATMVEARWGNLTASFPIAWNLKKHSIISLIRPPFSRCTHAVLQQKLHVSDVTTNLNGNRLV